MGLQYTYNQMLASLQDWHVDTNADFVAALPEIMNRGELMLQRDMDLATFDDQLTATITNGVAAVPKPATMVREHDLFITVAAVVRKLKKRDYAFLKLWGAATGAPQYYAELDTTQWIVAPVPNAGFTIDVSAIVRPQTLVDVGTTNLTWLSTHYPDLLWHANNYFACIYLKKWQLADEALAEYNRMLPQARAEAGNQRRVDGEDLHANRVHQNMPAGAAPPSET